MSSFQYRTHHKLKGHMAKDILAICPGYIATPQTAPLRETQPNGSKHPFDSFICAKTPAGRWLNPEELVGPAVFWHQVHQMQ